MRGVCHMCASLTHACPFQTDDYGEWMILWINHQVYSQFPDNLLWSLLSWHCPWLACTSYNCKVFLLRSNCYSRRSMVVHHCPRFPVIFALVIITKQLYLFKLIGKSFQQKFKILILDQNLHYQTGNVGPQKDNQTLQNVISFPEIINKS